MIDSFGRVVNHMRISVIGGCNLSCLYCDHEGRTTKDILSQQDVATVLKAAKELEIDSVKLKNDSLEVVWEDTSSIGLEYVEAYKL
ncbi:MAG: hypothetical protein QXL15_02560, partial [Candidatus Korarchaeota archaeon]